MIKPLHKPGEDNQRPGKYVETGPRGGVLNHPRVITIDPGDRLPPTSQAGNKWQKSQFYVIAPRR